MRASISPAERLALTLRFLATGNSQVLANCIKSVAIFTDSNGSLNRSRFRLASALAALLSAISSKKHVKYYGRYSNPSM